MPKKISGDDDMPRRRRRGVNALAVEADTQRGLVMRILLHSPKDMIAGALAFSAVSAIITNALFLQAGRHPAPMFGSVVVMPAVAPANPRPRPRPVEADAAQPEPKPAEPRVADPLAHLVKTTSAMPVVSSAVPRPSAPVPVSSHSDAGAASAGSSRRVAAVQRALTEYGYGQLKPTGAVGSDTQAAIQKFERTRKLPVTGQMSDR
ncbi:MAG: peptidoglycan-binding domain-containing protein, partial [Bradyrhizobium sp.]